MENLKAKAAEMQEIELERATGRRRHHDGELELWHIWRLFVTFGFFVIFSLRFKINVLKLNDFDYSIERKGEREGEDTRKTNWEMQSEAVSDPVTTV